MPEAVRFASGMIKLKSFFEYIKNKERMSMYEVTDKIDTAQTDDSDCSCFAPGHAVCDSVDRFCGADGYG